MKKPVLYGAILAAVALFAGADYLLNRLEPNASFALKPPAMPEEQVQAAPLDASFSVGTALGGRQVTSVMPARQLFERFDLSEAPDLDIFRHELKETGKDPITIYEVKGPFQEGMITYLNVKLHMIDQLNPVSETLNETNQFGENSLFFNDSDHPAVAFLLMQHKDRLYGFQYEKDEAGETYNDVKEIISLIIQ
jgi:hypothetical protein